MEQGVLSPIDEKEERRRVAQILVRLQRYVRGYLPDLRIDTVEDLSSNPLEVTIKVWWKNERDYQLIEEQPNGPE